MTAQITRQAIDSITIEVTMPLTGSMLQAEEAIQDALNEVGRLATEKNLQRFDTDGSPIQLGSVRMTSKGQFAQDYETPYGSISVLRHVYQTSEGGKTFCPLEETPEWFSTPHRDLPSWSRTNTRKPEPMRLSPIYWNAIIERFPSDTSSRWATSSAPMPLRKKRPGATHCQSSSDRAPPLRSALMERACFYRRMGGGWR